MNCEWTYNFVLQLNCRRFLPLCLYFLTRTAMGVELLMCLAFSKTDMLFWDLLSFYYVYLQTSPNLHISSWSCFQFFRFSLLEFKQLKYVNIHIILSSSNMLTYIYNLHISSWSCFLFSSLDASLLLHGQQYIEIYKPIPSCASVSSFPTLSNVLL